MTIGATGIALICLGASLSPTPRLVWNATASAPIGLYRVVLGARVRRGDMVVAAPPAAARRLAAARHYLPADVPLVKRVAAIGGDVVCARGTAISINGRWAAARLASDRLERPLPWWRGCRRLADGVLFLLMAEHRASFDGRYFGVTAPGEVIGRAVLLWRR